MTIELPERIEQRLTSEAAKRGLDVSTYVVELIDQVLPEAHPNAAILTWLKEWERENATDDPEEITRRQKEWEELKVGLDRNRMEMEGPEYRKLFP